MKIEREQLFIKEGVSPEVAKIAAEASYLRPNERTPQQKEAIHIVSQRIAQNNQALNDES